MLQYSITTLSLFITRCFPVLSLYANGYDTGKIRVQYGDTTGLHNRSPASTSAQYGTRFKEVMIVGFPTQIFGKGIFPYI